MNIIVNGETRHVDENITLQTLLDDMGMGGRRLAVEVNLDIVPRSSHASHVLNEGDRIEIVHAIGGG